MNAIHSPSHIDLDKLLEVLRKHKGRALHVMEVCSRLGVPNSQRDAVRAALDTLSEDNRIQELPGLRFRALKTAPAPRRSSPPPGASSAMPSEPRRVAPTAKVG